MITFSHESLQKMRFITVGSFNTALDFGLLFALKSFGVPILPANITSSTTAFCFSFFANKKFTFKTAGTNIKREIILFVIVTLFGLWVLQTAVIALVAHLLDNSTLSDDAILLISKLLATVVSLTWNYLLYSRVVFKK